MADKAPLSLSAPVALAGAGAAGAAGVAVAARARPAARSVSMSLVSSPFFGNCNDVFSAIPVYGARGLIDLAVACVYC